MLAEDGSISIAQSLEKPSRALDIGEHVGDRACGGVTHSDASYGSGGCGVGTDSRE